MQIPQMDICITDCKRKHTALSKSSAVIYSSKSGTFSSRTDAPASRCWRCDLTRFQRVRTRWQARLIHSACCANSRASEIESNFIFQRHVHEFVLRAARQLATCAKFECESVSCAPNKNRVFTGVLDSSPSEPEHGYLVVVISMITATDDCRWYERRNVFSNNYFSCPKCQILSSSFPTIDRMKNRDELTYEERRRYVE